ncbi:transposable element Tc1 transposase [Trichonephila clavipes]|nr:transposable element Tc1 transposase [Trichonephila clavipes]
MRGTLTDQRYVDDVLRPHVGPFLNGLPGAIFQQDNARRPTARVAQDFLRHFQTLPWPARSPDLAPVEHVWDQLKRQIIRVRQRKIVAYRDCGLSYREIGSRVGRNQTTVIRICDRWMQEVTTDRRGQSHLPQCTTSREDRKIVRKAVTDHSVSSRTVAQYIESVTHHSVSAHAIRRRLQQSGLSARRPLLGLPLDAELQTSAPTMVR